MKSWGMRSSRNGRVERRDTILRLIWKGYELIWSVKSLGSTSLGFKMFLGLESSVLGCTWVYMLL